MLAKHRTARWAKMAGWIILPVLVVPVGALAMFWAASLGLVPGLAPSNTVANPAVMMDKFSELGRLAVSAGKHLQRVPSDVLAQLRRQETAKPAVAQAPLFEILPPATHPSVTKGAPAPAQTVPAASAPVPSSAATPKKGLEQKAQATAAPATAAPAKPAEAKASLPQKAQAAQKTQAARTAAAPSSAPSSQTAPSKKTAAQSAPASAEPDKTPAPPATARLLAAPVQTTPPGMLATASCRAEMQAEKRPAPAAQGPDLQAEARPRQTDRASGSTFAAMMSHAVNPLATGTALAESKTPPANASQATSGDAASPEPAQTPEQPAFPDSFPQGSLGQMAKLRAELEQLKMQVHIEEVRQRLNQLKGQSGPPLPAPSLEFPPIGLPAPAAPASEPPRSALRLLSIQSLNGKYTATVGTDSGPRVVRVNETVDGYRVVSISRNSVVINRGKGNEMLSIYE